MLPLVDDGYLNSWSKVRLESVEGGLDMTAAELVLMTIREVCELSFSASEDWFAEFLLSLIGRAGGILFPFFAGFWPKGTFL